MGLRRLELQLRHGQYGLNSRWSPLLPLGGKSSELMIVKDLREEEVKEHDCCHGPLTWTGQLGHTVDNNRCVLRLSWR